MTSRDANQACARRHAQLLGFLGSAQIIFARERSIQRVLRVLANSGRIFTLGPRTASKMWRPTCASTALKGSSAGGGKGGGKRGRRNVSGEAQPPVHASGLPEEDQAKQDAATLSDSIARVSSLPWQPHAATSSEYVPNIRLQLHQEMRAHTHTQNIDVAVLIDRPRQADALLLSSRQVDTLHDVVEEKRWRVRGLIMCVNLCARG